jgi:Casein kinase II regulatory subunit
VQCSGQPVLPVGLKDEMGADTVKIFCPKCQCVYHPPPVRSRSSHHGGAGAAGVDGAAFGTTFPHLFLMTFSNLVPDPLPQNSSYVPRVFGFRVHSSTRQRAGAAASCAPLSSTSVARQRENADNNNRSSFVGRRLETTSKDIIERKPNDAVEHAEVPPESAAAGSQVEAITTMTKNQKDSVSSQAATGAIDDKDDGSRKLKSGKRRNDGDTGSKKSDANGSGSMDNTPKKRRKADNGNT